MKAERQPEPEPQQQPDAPQAGGPETAPGAEPEAAAAANEALLALERERDELRDLYQRALAEGENQRKRLQREMNDARLYGVADLARQVLGVVDDLRRALSKVPEDRRDDAFTAGMRLIEERLLKALADHGVTPVESLGQPFDPRWHEAILEDERSDLEPGTITEELTRGYRIADRLLRAAVVRVARAPAAATREEPDPERQKDAETPSGD